MKSLLVLAVFLATALAGCVSHSARSSAGNSPLHPNGTDVGTSFPGVNQAAPGTTATASSDSR